MVQSWVRSAIWAGAGSARKLTKLSERRTDLGDQIQKRYEDAWVKVILDR